jgi:2-alkenal reductase
VLQQVESNRVQQEQVVPAALAATPTMVAATAVATTAATTNEAESLQDTLIRLYQQANPSVVYIVVGQSSGSGFVYGNEGYIITNHHVASAGQSYEVVFSSGDRQPAELVGTDADSDLAVLRVDRLPTGVKPPALASADDIKVGQLAVAIGNPFGEQGSMSLGIVSGLSRSLRSQRGIGLGSGNRCPRSFRPTHRSTPVTRAARCSTSRAR